MTIIRILASVAILFALGLMPATAAAAEEDPSTIDRSISRPQALQLVRDLFSRFCQTSRNFDCAIGTQSPTSDCPFLFLVIVPTGERPISIWVSLDHRGRVVALSETRAGACSSA